MRSSPRRSRGLALVLLLLAIAGFLTAFLVYSALGTVSRRLDANATSASSFKALDEALARYVMLNQRLPCPASGTANAGIADPDTAVATCNSPSGVVPWATLGLSKGDATDPWGRYIAYRVYDGASGFTQSNGLALANCLDEPVATIYALSGGGSTCNTITHENTVSDFFVNKGLTVNDRGSANTQVAYALISMGESGLGAYYPGGAVPMASPDSSSKEFLNAGSGGTYWIMAPSDPSVPATSVSHFDDVVSYSYAMDLAHNARLAGRPWKLYQVFTQAALGLSPTNYNTNNASMKVRPPSAGVNQGPVTVTAAADTARVICATSTTVPGISPCVAGINNGNDMLDNSNNEALTFDFRVTRKAVVIALTDFRIQGGGGSNREQAQVTFYNGSTQVDQRTVQACSGGGNQVAQFTIANIASPGIFTKVTVRALTESGSATSSSFGVAAVLACKLSSDCPVGSAPAVTGWPAIDCFG